MTDIMDNPATKSDLIQSTAERILSVDVLRGFDMCWIVGAEHVVKSLDQFGSGPIVGELINQLKHRKWEGLVFYDIIFPLFIFLMGVSLVFSLTKIMAREGKKGAHIRIIKRFVIMFLLGIFYYKGLMFGIQGIRLMGVLQRLALCYLFTAILFCHFKPRVLVGIFLGIIIGYWALLSFVPVPDLGIATFEMGKNWAAYIDNHYLPCYKIYGTWDPEGILSNVPAVATCLLGVFGGFLLKSERIAPAHKGLCMMLIGIALTCLGYAWGIQFPIIKKIWTSSYVLVAGGYSYLLLGITYQIVDVWRYRAWTKPFVWIGVNALAVYMVWNILDFDQLSKRIMGGPIHDLLGRAGDLGIALFSLLLVFLFARFLYKKSIYIKI
jgi:predicted acyltransferase